MQPGTTTEYDDFNAAAQRVAHLAQEFESLSDLDLRDMAADLLQAIDTLHRAPLERLIGLIRSAGRQDLLLALYGDPLVSELLRLYDLLPCEGCSQASTHSPRP